MTGLRINALSQKTLAIGCFIVLMIYLLPNWLFWEGSQFMIHDNLDSNVVWFKNLAESASMFSYNIDAKIPQTLGGLSRSFYPSELNLLILLYYLFPPFIAYNINIILLHVTAFLGMFLVIRDSKILPPTLSTYISLGVALCFSIIPFWPSGGITIAGQPLLIWAMLNVYFRRNQYVSWAVVIFFPFYSSFFLGNIFFFFTLGVIFLFYSFKLRRFDWRMGLFFLTLLTCSIIVEQRLLLMFMEGVSVQRDVWLSNAASLNLGGLIGVSIEMLFKGQYHFFARVFPIMPIISLAGFIVASKKIKTYILLLFCLAIIFSVIRVSRSYSLVVENLPFFQKFNPRFHSMLPLLWFFIVTLAVCALMEFNRWGVYFSILGFLAFVSVNLFNFFNKDYQGADYIENSFYYSFIGKNGDSSASFDTYYRTDEFSLVKKRTGFIDSYVICVGIEPEIAQFNGYKTLGGYYAIWPLDYCMKINKLKGKLAEECNRRCYFTLDEVESEGFSTTEMRALKSSLILSTVEINNPKFQLKDMIQNKSDDNFFVFETVNFKASN